MVVMPWMEEILRLLKPINHGMNHLSTVPVEIGTRVRCSCGIVTELWCRIHAWDSPSEVQIPYALEATLLREGWGMEENDFVVHPLELP